MNRLFILLAAVVFCSCQRSATNEEDHGHPHDPEPTTLAYTVYSAKTELFVEFRPLVVGQSTRFAAHFTKLGQSFTSLNEGKITLSLTVGEKGIRTVSDKASSPGIFRLALKPAVAGVGRLVFDIETADYKDRIVIDSVVVFADQNSADAVAPEEGEAGEISFLKEQAWKIDFANEQLSPRIFNDVIKVSGILSAPAADEQVVASRSAGVVQWSEAILNGAMVSKGQRLFVIASGNLAKDNIESQYREAKANFEKAEADLKRVEPLRSDKIISEKDYLEIKNRYDQARISFETLGRNYTGNGQAVTSPINGFVKEITAQSGEFVKPGQALAVITKSQSLQLQADVPLRYANDLSSITEAQFKTIRNNSVYNTRELNGKVMSYGKAIGANTTLLPIYFSLMNTGDLIPGDAVEVYLKSRPIPNALVVPATALIEEQGSFYVYVQTAGESFVKRSVTLGAQDGRMVQLLSGVAAGERVVTKGGYLIKLATQSGSVPAHGHEH
jgi:membrane fusion protein, heavy metal efflux system